MNKEDKIKLLNEYRQTEKGKIMLNRLTRIMITGIVGLLYAIGLGIYLYVTKTFEIIDLLSIIPLFFASILFIIMSIKLKNKELTKLIKKKRT